MPTASPFAKSRQKLRAWRERFACRIPPPVNSCISLWTNFSSAALNGAREEASIATRSLHLGDVDTKCANAHWRLQPTACGRGVDVLEEALIARSRATAEVLAAMEDLATRGMTVITVIHEMGFARKVADQVVFMHRGKIWDGGPTSELLARPQTAEFRQFISSEL
jgi:hypothetical protein